jgi:hypothetical protein
MNFSNPTEAFTAMLHAFDAKDWRAVRAALADEVDVDYSSLSGVPAARSTGDELVGGWERVARAFEATQHMTGPVVVSPMGRGLYAQTHVRAYHRMKDGRIWMVAGHYEIQLTPAGDLWKISGIKLSVLYQEGRVDIPATVS